MTALWINPNQGIALTPPAIVMALGDTRSAENLEAAGHALEVTTAARYAPGEHTFCNIFTSDWTSILKAPLLHLLGGKEMRANDMQDALNDGRYTGWSKTGTMASALAVRNLAAVGVPQVAVWKNPNTARPGHIVGVIKSRDARVWVIGAGGRCTLGCPIEDQFGNYTKDVQFFASTR